MTKKDYERAAEQVQELRRDGGCKEADIAEQAFVEFFTDDNGRFDEGRFRRACVVGANVRARRA